MYLWRQYVIFGRFFLHLSLHISFPFSSLNRTPTVTILIENHHNFKLKYRIKHIIWNEIDVRVFISQHKKKLCFIIEWSLFQINNRCSSFGPPIFLSHALSYFSACSSAFFFFQFNSILSVTVYLIYIFVCLN